MSDFTPVVESDTILVVRAYGTGICGVGPYGENSYKTVADSTTWTDRSDI